MYLRMTRRAERDEHFQGRSTRDAMVHDNRALITARGRAYAAATPVSLQGLLAKPAEVAGIVLPEGVAGGTVAVGADLLSAAPAIQRSLQSLSHIPS